MNTALRSRRSSSRVATKIARPVGVLPEHKTRGSTSKRVAEDEDYVLSTVDDTSAEEQTSDSASDDITVRPRPKRPKRLAPPIPLHLPSPPAHRPHYACPDRRHSSLYHRPLLLYGPQAASARAALLSWFDVVHDARAMPWRKPFVDPCKVPPAKLREAQAQRGYEVWISEIMLQQTRVAVVVDYWLAWMKRWPSMARLAAAEPADVLACWQGLGYYSRATRIHKAAQIVVADPDMRGRLPDSADVLARRVPGVGRYTAGAIAAIVYGKAEPMVDGNVLRVLSRQLGVYANTKTDRRVIELLWAAADAFAKAVALPIDPDESDESDVSDRPGRWGQALMELGSTVCTPKPNCSLCPITVTCRAYGEGEQLATPEKASPIDPAAAVDIEDLCGVCDAFAPEEPAVTRQGKPKARKETAARDTASAAMDVIVNHARRFPVKAVKKAVREQETVACAIRCRDGQYLIHRRPEKGLLAGMWELPSYILPESNDSTLSSRTLAALSYAAELVAAPRTGQKPRKQKPPPPPLLHHHGELASVPWLFSHLKLTTHVHLFSLDAAVAAASGDTTRCQWATADQVGLVTMGTGMRKCWNLVKEQSQEG